MQRAHCKFEITLVLLQTTVQPAARAGAIFLVNRALGKFQGVMPATTPTGCRIATIRLSLDGPGIVSP